MNVFERLSQAGLKLTPSINLLGSYHRTISVDRQHLGVEALTESGRSLPFVAPASH